MAVDGYLPIPKLDCIDQDYFPFTHRSLLALEQAAKDGGGEVECVHINGSVSGDTTTGETCVQLIEPADMPDQLINGDQTCCLLISMFGSMPDVGSFLEPLLGNSRETSVAYHNPYQGIKTTIRCSGRTINTDEGRGAGVISAILDPTTCDFSNGLEICFEAYTDSIVDIPYFASWCGCFLCIQCPPLPLTDVYIPRNVFTECEYGLSDFALIIQAINQLSSAFRCAGYTVECVMRTGLDFSAPITDPAETYTKWIGVACTTASWAFAPYGSTVRVNAEMGCEGRAVPCNSAAFVTYGNGRLSSGSAEFISIACGECQTGERLWFNSAPEINCASTDVEEEQEEAGILALDQESDVLYFVFRKLENVLPSIPQIDTGCIFREDVDRVADSAELIFEAACEVQKPNKTAIRFTADGATGEHTTIVPAQPWPPPTPPPRPVPDPPPVKKWLVLGSAQAFVSLSAGILVLSGGRISTRFNYEIKCGGVVVHTSPDYFWPTIVIGVSLPISFRVPVCAFVDCPIDQDLEVCMNIVQPLATQVRGNTEGIALCIV